MTGYSIVVLDEMISELGEERTKNILSSFSCPLNKDVENFLKHKAIEFSKQGLSKTHLVFASKNNSVVLVGYFTLALKYINATRSSLSSSYKKRLKKFSQYDPDIKEYIMPSPLIGQLGKNFTDGYNKLISGDELLGMALEKIGNIHGLAGGKTAYLECEDKQCLIDFYTRHNFKKLALRQLERDETNLQGEYLVQMIKYFK